MKKTYILGMALLAGSMSFAQKSSNNAIGKTIITNEINRETRPSTQNRASGDLIGTIMDFSTPADWVNDGANVQDWLIGTTTPNGSYTSNAVAIASTSGGNFALIQGDGFTGTAILTMAMPVDLSSYTNVAFEFESYYRNFNGSCFIDVSIDNGLTWNNSYAVHEILPLSNENTQNPEVVNINISNIASAQSSVTVRFRYNSTDDYFWMIDDAKFVEGYEDDIVLEQTFMSAGTQALDYYMIPNSQISEITFGAWAYNGGINPQTMTTLNVLVDNNGNNEFTGASDAVTIAPFTRDSFEISTNGWTPAEDKTYRVTYGIASTGTEQTPNNNIDTLYNITTGGMVYARDNGISTGATEHLGDPTVNVATEMGNIFDIIAPVSFEAIQIGLSTNTEVGAILKARISKWDGSAYVIKNQAEHTVLAGEPGTIIEVALPELVGFAAGDDISITVYHDENNKISVYSAQTTNGVLLYNNEVLSTANSAFIVRGVTSTEMASIDTDELSNSLDAFPNPANENVNINFSISDASNVSITLVSVTGKTVYHTNLGTISAGKYSENVNASKLANGIYFYTLTVNGIATTKKLVISKK